jgi:outer membrane cobalamin receptor
MNVVLLVLALVQQPQDTVVLKPVIVTATRVPVSPDLVSSAVTVLRGADLAARGVRTVAQALQSVPGAHVVGRGAMAGRRHCSRAEARATTPKCCSTACP